MTICGIPLNNIQSLRIYGAANHKPGRKETLCSLKKVSIYSAFNILLGPVRVRHCWRKLWFDSLNNQLAKSCGMEKRLFSCVCPTWSLITWTKGQWSYFRQELGTSSVPAIFKLVLKGHISPPVWNYLRKTSSVSHTAVSLAGWMFVIEWLLLRCDEFTFQIWTSSLVTLPPGSHLLLHSFIIHRTCSFYLMCFLQCMISYSICVHNLCECEYERLKSVLVCVCKCVLDNWVGLLCMKPETRLLRGEVILEYSLRCQACECVCMKAREI